MKIILGLTDYNNGKILFKGLKIIPRKDNNFKSKVGFLIDQASCYSDLTVYQNLTLFRSLKYELSDCYSVDEVIKLLNLTKYKHIKFCDLSLGNKQRLLISISILNKPELLILDEPLNGLDPQGIIEIRKLIKVLVNENNMTIIISSHVLDELSKVIDTLGIIHNGSIIFEENINVLSDHLKKEFIIKFDRNEYTKAKNIINNLHFTFHESCDYKIIIPDFNIERRTELIQKLVEKNIVPLEFKLNTMTLEKLYFKVLNKEVNK